MVSIGIIITQNEVSGGVGESRQDLVLGNEVELSNISSSGIDNYRWSLIGKPYTSSVSLSSTSEETTTFTPDVEGSYLVQLIINNKIKQTVVCAVLTERYNIRIPAAGEGKEIAGGSFKAITEAIRVLEENALDAAMLQGTEISLNEPLENHLLRFDGDKWIPGEKIRTNDLGTRSYQNILIKIPLSAAIPASPLWQYKEGTGGSPPFWECSDVSGALPCLDFSWNQFPHGSMLRKICVVASCPSSSTLLRIIVNKTGVVWSDEKITSFSDSFISSSQRTIASPTRDVIEVSSNTSFTHGNETDDSVVSEGLAIRLMGEGNKVFRIFDIYVYFQTLAIGLYSGPQYEEGEEGGPGGPGGGSGGGTLDESYNFGGPGEGRVIVANSGAVEINSETSVSSPLLYIENNDENLCGQDDDGSLVINNAGYNPSISLMGSSAMIWADNLQFISNGSCRINLNDSTDRELSGFSSSSIIGALNELRGEESPVVFFLETRTEFVSGGSEYSGSINIGIEHGIVYSLKVEITGGTAPTGADVEMADAHHSGSHELLYKIGLAGEEPRWKPSINPVWKDRTPFGIEGLTNGELYFRFFNLGSEWAFFRITVRGMGFAASPSEGGGGGGGGGLQ